MYNIFYTEFFTINNLIMENRTLERHANQAAKDVESMINSLISEVE